MDAVFISPEEARKAALKLDGRLSTSYAGALLSIRNSAVSALVIGGHLATRTAQKEAIPLRTFDRAEIERFQARYMTLRQACAALGQRHSTRSLAKLGLHPEIEIDETYTFFYLRDQVESLISN